MQVILWVTHPKSKNMGTNLKHSIKIIFDCEEYLQKCKPNKSKHMSRFVLMLNIQAECGYHRIYISDVEVQVELFRLMSWDLQKVKLIPKKVKTPGKF